KSVTSPIGMLVADEIGGLAALAAVAVMITGVLGAMSGPARRAPAPARHPAAGCMAASLTTHAAGSTPAPQEAEVCGAFSALAMSLMGVATAVLLPLLIALIV